MISAGASAGSTISIGSVPSPVSWAVGWADGSSGSRVTTSSSAAVVGVAPSVVAGGTIFQAPLSSPPFLDSPFPLLGRENTLMGQTPFGGGRAGQS